MEGGLSILGALTLHLGFFSASLVLQPTRMALLCALLGTALTFKNTFKEMVQPSLEDQGSKERARGETWTLTGVDARPNRPSQLTYLTASDTCQGAWTLDSLFLVLSFLAGGIPLSPGE